MSSKVFALVDANSFFCNCERLFRPELRKYPVIVLSNNDGCVVARSSEAKLLGIKMGEPYFQIKDLCELKNVHVFSSNFSLYTDVSDRLMKSLSQFCPMMEVYSVDEAFLDLSHVPPLEVLDYAKMIKEKVEQEVGIPVSIGIAPTKTMAKLANHVAKKSQKACGVVNLMDKKFQDIALGMVDIEDVWGIGRASSEKLKRLKILKARDLRDYPNEVIIQKVLTKVGLQRKHELMGISCFPITPIPAVKKEIISSRSFGKGVYTHEDLKESVASFVSAACEKLRSQNSVCGHIEVYARTSFFSDRPQYQGYQNIKLEVATLDTRKLIKQAWSALRDIYQGGFEYKKAGIKLSDLRNRDSIQMSFFSTVDDVLSERLMQTMDKINLKYGPGTLKAAACGVDNKAWAMNRDHKSPRYTTSWGELPRVS